MTANSMAVSDKLQKIEMNAALITKRFMHLTAYEECYRKIIADMNTVTDFVRGSIEHDELDANEAAYIDEATELFEQAARAIAAYKESLDRLREINQTIIGD